MDEIHVLGRKMWMAVFFWVATLMQRPRGNLLMDNKRILSTLIEWAALCKQVACLQFWRCTDRDRWPTETECDAPIYRDPAVGKMMNEVGRKWHPTSSETSPAFINVLADHHCILMICSRQIGDALSTRSNRISTRHQWSSRSFMQNRVTRDSIAIASVSLKF